MNGIVGRTSSHWVRYSDYEWKSAADGVLYLTPVKNAKPSIYDPMKEYEQIVVDAMNIGRLCMGKKPDEEIQTAIREFALKYGLLGLMTALPTTPTFMDYEAVYLPKNHFIKAETMNTLEYVASKYGTTFHKVNRFFASSRLCECGYKNDTLTLREREWTCPVCGLQHDRDLNAARNIYRRGVADLESTSKTVPCTA
jgi:hypothetical protein